MKCPACDHRLSHIHVDGIKIDICRGGCGGVWFDNHEFKKFDEPHEEAGSELLDVERNPNCVIDHSQRRDCPHCDGMVMMRHFFSVRREVEIDECPGCAGIWLDAGELAKIRTLFNTEEEKREAAKQMFDDMFGPRMELLREQSKEDLSKARRFANMFKYILPSHYLPGKQDWGAF